jgi:hypothetical protein
VRRVPAEPASFALVVGVYLVHLFVAGYDRFYYDSAQYWQYGKTFESNGHFSLLAYSSEWRGYSMPLLSHVLQVVGSSLGLGDVTVVKIFGALLAATLGVVVVPRLAKRLFPGAAVTPTRVLVLNALIFLYWRDHFDFPLTDFPTLVLASLSVLALLRATPLGFLVAGLTFGLAMNMRPNYLPALLVLCAVAALLASRPRGLRRAALAVVVVFAGAVVATMPQMLINHDQRGTWSPFLAKSHEELLISLYLGMHAQKYETYVGPAQNYPTPGVSYLDPATIQLMKSEHISAVTAPDGHLEFPSTGKYFRLVARHPFQMGASYVRHVFNGLDVRYPTPYIRNLKDTWIGLSLLEYTLLFLAFARLIVPRSRNVLGRVQWKGVVVLASTCASMVVIQAEPRYWLPLQLLVYMLACFGPAFRASFLGGAAGYRVGLAVSYVAFVLVCLALSTATQAQLEFPLRSAAASTMRALQ